MNNHDSAHNLTDSTDDYDSPWKDMLENAFPEFMAFYFPEAHRQIDWSRGYEFKNTELRQIIIDAELGKRFADVLVQVTVLDGSQNWVYIHVEVQGQHDPQFTQRMFIYNYRLFDRYAQPIASFAVLADDRESWRPGHYEYSVLGCKHRLDFPVAKLLDYAERIHALETEANPFAIVTAAHLRTRQTKHDPEQRYHAKWTLTKLLYRQGWQRQRIIELFKVLDWMMRLPTALEQKLWQDIEQLEGEKKMQYVTSIERMAIERGLQRGLQQGMQQGIGIGESRVIERLLVKRFGPLSEETSQRLRNATVEQLERWTERILDAASLNEVFADH
jgi:hypothetical protein